MYGSSGGVKVATGIPNELCALCEKGVDDVDVEAGLGLRGFVSDWRS